MTDLAMPRLSDSMEEGTIVKWLVDDGASVVEGQEIVEIETDKATIAHTAEATGTIEIVAPEGTTLAVGETIARVGVAAAAASPVAPEPASPAEAAPSVDAASPTVAAPSAEPTPPADAAGAHEPASAPTPAPSPEPARAAIPVAGAAAASSNGHGAVNTLATPLARRVARLHAIELASIVGTGPRGRVTRTDVLRAAGLAEPAAAIRAARTAPGWDAPTQPAAASHPAAPEPWSREQPWPRAHPGGEDTARGAKGTGRRVEPSRLQQLIARRMAEAKATIPHFQVQTEVRMDAAVALREGLKESAAGEPVPSLNDLVVKACALALRRHPQANGSYVDGGFELHERINIGVAVASENALVVPVVSDADRRSLGSIAAETRRLAERVRTGAIAPPELSGGTFTVSNLGMFGMTAISPVINPPQAAILGVGALRPTLARENGQIVDVTLMTLTLSCDHRILYGADAAWLLSDVRALLEKPLGLVL